MRATIRQLRVTDGDFITCSSELQNSSCTWLKLILVFKVCLNTQRFAESVTHGVSQSAKEGAGPFVRELSSALGSSE